MTGAPSRLIDALDALDRARNLQDALGAAIDGDGLKAALSTLAIVVRESLDEALALIDEEARK